MTFSSRRPRDPRDRVVCRNHYTATEAYEAREHFVLGWSLDLISRRTEIPRSIIYKWCVLGLHHRDAIPPGFAEAMGAYVPPRLSSTDRIDQFPRRLIRQWRQSYMDEPAELGRIQLEIRDLDLPFPVTGLEQDGWAATDLTRMLLGSSEGRNRPYPQSRESLPRGYLRWWKSNARRLTEELTTVESKLRHGKVSPVDMDLLAPLLGSLVNDLEPDEQPSRPLGYVGELECVTPFSPLKPMPLQGGIRRGCIRSALALANALMNARAEDKTALSSFVKWLDASTHHDDQRSALTEDVLAIAERCGFTACEAKRIYRLAQEVRFLRGAGKKDMADRELKRVLDIFDSQGVIAEPDTSFTRSQLHVRPGVLLTGRFDRAARRVRLREQRDAIREASREPSEARPL